MGCLTDTTVSDPLAPFLSNNPFLLSDILVDHAVIDSEAVESSFASLTLGPGNRAEVKRYLEARPGFGLNLSRKEMDAFRALEASGKDTRSGVDELRCRHL